MQDSHLEGLNKYKFELVTCNKKAKKCKNFCSLYCYVAIIVCKAVKACAPDNGWSNRILE